MLTSIPLAHTLGGGYPLSLRIIILVVLNDYYLTLQSMNKETQQQVDQLVSTSTQTITELTKLVRDNKDLINIGITIAAIYVWSKK